MRKKTECIDCLTTDCFIKRHCFGDSLKKISDSKNQNYYIKGDSIFREGNTMLGIHFIQTGGTKIVTHNLNGREQVVRLVSPGSILGHRVLGNDKYYFNAIALIVTSVCFLESSLFMDICMSNPEFSYNLLLFYGFELRQTELRVKYHAQMNIREKVAEAFVYLNQIFGIHPKDKTLNVDLSRQEIADIAGTTSEQVTRQLSDFEEEKLILRKKREIQIINIRGLEKIVSDYKTD